MERFSSPSHSATGFEVGRRRRSLPCENCFLMLSLNSTSYAYWMKLHDDAMWGEKCSRQLYAMLLRLCNVIKKFDFAKPDIDTHSTHANDWIERTFSTLWAHAKAVEAKFKGVIYLANFTSVLACRLFSSCWVFLALLYEPFVFVFSPFYFVLRVSLQESRMRDPYLGRVSYKKFSPRVAFALQIQWIKGVAVFCFVNPIGRP